MKLKRAYSAEPISDETARRLKMGRNWTRLVGVAAAGIGALSIPLFITGIGMGFFKLEDKTVAVFPKVMTEEEAKAATQRIQEEAKAFRDKKAEGQQP